MGNELDEVLVTTPWERGVDVGAEAGAFGLFEDFRAFLTGADFFGEGESEDFA